MVEHRLIEGQLAADDATQVLFRHQAQLDIQVGQAQIAVEQQGSGLGLGQGVGQGYGKPRLADAALARRDGDHVASLGRGARGEGGC